MSRITPYEDSPLRRYPRGPYNKIEPCYFCKDMQNETYAFQGVAICLKCNQKFIDRVQLLLKFE
jgi:hypothetical protein